MPSLEILLTFLATTAIFAFIPGPAMLYAAARPWRAAAGPALWPRWVSNSAATCT
jgi:threonine/homoserine/homoserine lactone efflux protein